MMNEEYLSWNEHPLSIALKTNNRLDAKKYVHFYMEQFQRSGFISMEENQILHLIPYTDKVTTDLLMKTQIEAYKLLFECQDKDFYPIILRVIIRLFHNEYKDGHMRRKIYRLIMNTADSHQHDVIKGYAYKGCVSGKLIRCFHIEHLYQTHPNLIYALENTRFDRSMFKDEKN